MGCFRAVALGHAEMSGSVNCGSCEIRSVFGIQRVTVAHGRRKDFQRAAVQIDRTVGINAVSIGYVYINISAVLIIAEAVILQIRIRSVNAVIRCVHGNITGIHVQFGCLDALLGPDDFDYRPFRVLRTDIQHIIRLNGVIRRRNGKGSG